jgi:suppressor of G2 allele of SKP1
LERYQEAQTHLEQSKELNPSEKSLVTWLRKNTEKLPKEEPVKAEPAQKEPAPVPATPQSQRAR